MENFSEEKIQKVWEKGETKAGYDPEKRRFDKCGAQIYRSKYGDRDSKYGWEIDHIIPKSKGGSDNISNLQPLQWENNASKGDGSNNSDFCVVNS